MQTEQELGMPYVTRDYTIPVVEGGSEPIDFAYSVDTTGFAVRNSCRIIDVVCGSNTAHVLFRLGKVAIFAIA